MIRVGIRGKISKTGENNADEVYNIYDLEGNLYEYTAERWTTQYGDEFIYRGGSCSHYHEASNRYSSVNGGGDVISGFRICLYIFRNN